MSEHIFEAFSLFLTFQNLAIVFVGVLVGTFVGAIPGMTTPMGVALALPFTFTMEPVTGILLLLGIYKGGLYGGSITAILIKAPGTPAASCTVLDGYPMTQKGEASTKRRLRWPNSALVLMKSRIILGVIFLVAYCK